MAKDYQRKWHLEKKSLDDKPRGFKKHIESANRWAAKRAIEKEVRTYNPDQETLDERQLRFDLDMRLANQCMIDEARHDLWGKQYKCTCPNVYDLTMEEVQALLDTF